MSDVIHFLKTVIRRINNADVMGLSAQLAYFFLLSLFPFLLFVVTLVGYLPLDSVIITDIIGTYLPEDVTSMIEMNLDQLMNNRRGSLLSLSIIGTLWSASNGMNAMTKSFNRAYNVTSSRSFLTARVIAIGLTIGMIIVIIVALFLPVFGKVIGEQFFAIFYLSEDFLRAWNTMRWVISSLIFFIVFLALYYFAPHTHVRIRDVVWGALFATIVWQIASLLFSFYVNTIGNYSATYGSLGTVIALMIWFYLSGIIITTGGVLNAILHERISKQK